MLRMSGIILPLFPISGSTLGLSGGNYLLPSLQFGSESISFILCVMWEHFLELRTLISPIAHSHRDKDGCLWSLYGMTTYKENPKYLEITYPVLICPPQSPHGRPR